MTTRPGTTLLELILGLLILAILLGGAAVPLTGLRDRLAVTGACQRFTASLALARAAALMHGGAVLVIDPEAWEWRVVPTPYSPHSGQVRVPDVAIEVGGQEPVIRFDHIGIGRLANRTITFTRGRAQARLTLSIYGRASRCG
jgi:Tfp pilus assembly protein FimT